MGTIVSAHCTACALHAEDLFIGVGMDERHSFLRNEVVYCVKCEHLKPAPHLYSPETFVKFANRLKPTNEGSEYSDDLLRSVAEALHRRCPQCNTAWKTVRFRDKFSFRRPARSIKCPRCAKPTLRIEDVGLWD